MRTKLTMSLATALVLGTMAYGAAAAQAVGPFWSVGETEVKENLAVKAKSVSTLTFEDKASGGFAISCTVTEEGSIGTEGKGEIKAATASGCKNVKNCSEPETAKAVHLPWKIKLQEVGETPEMAIVNSGSGQPGWLLECTVLGIKIKDECTGEAAGEVENVAGGSDGVFKSSLEHLSCTVGGSNTGVISGGELIENIGESQVGAIFLRLTAIATGTRKEPMNGLNTCEYTLKFENCTVEIQNHSNVGVKISLKQLKGIEATTRYGIPTEGCTVNLNLAARTGKCSDIVRLLVNPAVGWTNFLTVNARDTPFTATPTAEGNLITY